MTSYRLQRPTDRKPDKIRTDVASVSEMPCRIMIVRPPALGLISEPKKNLKPTYPHPTTTTVPPISQAIVAAMLQEELPAMGMEADISIVDMRSEKDQEGIRVNEYRSIDYGDSVIRCYRVGGMDFDDLNVRISTADVICLTAIFTTEARILKDFIEHCKKVKPEVRILVGGKDATARPDYYLAAGADVVVRGYGNKAGAEAIKRLVEDKPLEGIQGINTNSIEVVSPPSKSGDYGKLPVPAFDLIDDLSGYTGSHGGGFADGVGGPSMYISFSRGCFYGCRFCLTSKERYDFLSLTQTERLLEHYKEHGIKVLLSSEDNFLQRMDPRVGYEQGRSEVMQIMRKIREMGFAICFENGLQMSLFGITDDKGNFRVDEELVCEVLQHNFESGQLVGTARLHWPLETFAEHSKLDQRMTKLCGWEQLIHILKEVAKIGIPQIAFGLINFHDDGEQDLKRIMERCAEIRSIVQEASGGRTTSYFSVFSEIFIPAPVTCIGKQTYYSRRVISQRF